MTAEEIKDLCQRQGITFERTMTLMTIPTVSPHWGLVTSEGIYEDEVEIRMYPDEEDNT